jgi:hypothetical protein
MRPCPGLQYAGDPADDRTAEECGDDRERSLPLAGANGKRRG